MDGLDGKEASDLFGILECCAPQLLASLCGTSVRVKDVIGVVNGYSCCKKRDRLVILFGCECLVALIFEGVCLTRMTKTIQVAKRAHLHRPCVGAVAGDDGLGVAVGS